MKHRRTSNGLGGSGLTSLQTSAKTGGHAERMIRNHRNPELANVCLSCTKNPCTGTIRCMKQRRKDLEEKEHEK